MAPLPPSSTPRFKIFYTNVGVQHILQIRSADSPSAVGTQVDAFLTALSTKLFATIIDEVQFAPSGSDIFNSVTTGIEGNLYGSGAGTVTNVPLYMDFVGRSSDGRRVRATVFGANDTGSDFRYGAGESAPIDAAVAFLQGAGNNWLTIGGLAPVWKNYANGGFNAHWQRAVRP